MFDFADSIKAVGEAFTSLFNYCQTNTEHQSETQTGEDTISAAETIHTIYQIDGIDDSATGDKGQR